MGADVRFVRAESVHAVELAGQMRFADAEECAALGFSGPLEALQRSLADSSLARTMIINGQVAAMFGVVPLESKTALGPPVKGVVWLLTGEAIDKHKKEFVRWSKAAVATLLEHCPVLCNIVDGRYTGALRWARWIGFTIGSPSVLEPSGVDFYPIVIRRPSSWAQLAS